MQDGMKSNVLKSAFPEKMIIGMVKATSQAVAAIFFLKLILNELSVPVIRIKAGNSIKIANSVHTANCKMSLLS